MASMTARYEFKYFVPPHLVATIRDVARTYLQADAFGDDGAYCVTSLYLDAYDWLLARQTLEGQRNRFKLRIRTYDAYGHDPVFAETKERVGASIVKRRALVPREHASALARNGSGAASATVEVGDLGALLAFRALQDRIDARPRLWVRYQREAYQSPYGDGARLTFDSALEVQLPCESGAFLPSPTRWARVPLPQATILELKFNWGFPGWMDTLTRQLGLPRSSCSKYLLGAEQEVSFPWATAERRFSWTAS